MNDLVTVIVPVYNSEKYLEKCLDSIVRQTYHNIEVIIVDDGSTDNSEAVYRKFSGMDPRIKIYKQMNKGASAARNYGLSVAKGDFIYTCDSDDYIAVDAIERIIDVMKDSCADFVFFDGKTFSDADPSDKGTYKRMGRYEPADGMTMAKKLFINDEYKPGSPLALYRRDLLIRNKISFFEGIICEDELFSFYTYNHAKKVIYLDDQLYNRRIREGSVMASSVGSTKKFISCYTVFLEMLKYCKNDKELVVANYEFLDRLAKSTLFAYRLMSDCDRTEYNTPYQNMIKLIRQYNGFGDFTLLLRLYNWKAGILLSGIRKAVRKRLYGKS